MRTLDIHEPPAPSRYLAALIAVLPYLAALGALAVIAAARP